MFRVILCQVPVLVCLAPPPAACFDRAFDRLPATEREARVLLEDGTLDSAEWKLFQRFYSEPLSVPLGEMRYLADVFPELGDELPVLQSQLEKYEPWTAQDIERFFDDFPQLVALRPLLVFDTRPGARIGVAGFGTRLPGRGAAARQSVRYAVRAGDVLRAEGGVDFEDNFARWDRRRLALRFSAAEIQAGNFSSRHGDGLVFGYFPEIPESSAAVPRATWLYADSRTYNGAACAVDAAKALHLAALLHHRPNESALGAETAIKFSRRMRMRIGATALDAVLADSGRDSSLALHAIAAFSAGTWELEALGALNSREPGSIPLVLRAGYRHGGGMLGAQIFVLPGLYHAPRSRLVRDAQRALGQTDTTREYITGCDVSYQGPFFGGIEQQWRVRYLAARTAASLRARYGLEGTRPFAWALGYSYSPSESVNHRLHGECARRIHRKVELGADGSLYARAGAYRRAKIGLSAAVDALPAITFSPSAAYAVTSDGAQDVALGLGQRLFFFEKTYGELRITVPVLTVREEGVVVYAKSSFFF